jgi:hypothetical protein
MTWRQGPTLTCKHLTQVQTGSGAHPAAIPMGTGGSVPGREADNSPSHSAQAKNVWRLILTPRIRLNVVVLSWAVGQLYLHLLHLGVSLLLPCCNRAIYIWTMHSLLHGLTILLDIWKERGYRSLYTTCPIYVLPTSCEQPTKWFYLTWKIFKKVNTLLSQSWTWLTFQDHKHLNKSSPEKMCIPSGHRTGTEHTKLVWCYKSQSSETLLAFNTFSKTCLL